MGATGLLQLAAILAVPPVAWGGVLVAQRLRGPGRSTGDELVRKLSALAGMASLIAAVGTAAEAAASGAFWNVADLAPVIGEASPDAPDIYLLMLDGYPRSDVLAQQFGVDNSGFLGELESRGFEVADDSRSNYSITWLTLASLFQMAYAHELPALEGVSERGPEQYRVLGELVNRSPAFGLLRRAGYQIVTSPSPFSEIEIVTADRSFPVAGRTWFETELIADSPLSDLLSPLIRAWALEERRSAVNVELARLVDVARRDDGQPAFMFDHIVSPHAPFVFAADGSARPLPRCYPESCLLFESNPRRLGLAPDDYADALAGQIAYLNGRLLETIDKVTAARPDAAIVLFSDHGTRYDLGADPTEATRNFFAARLPDRPDLFDDSVHLVNLLPILLNAYAGTEIPTMPFSAWVSTGYPLQVEPLDSPRAD